MGIAMLVTILICVFLTNITFNSSIQWFILSLLIVPAADTSLEEYDQDTLAE